MIPYDHAFTYTNRITALFKQDENSDKPALTGFFSSLNPMKLLNT
jgi:hypothetical protein